MSAARRRAAKLAPRRPPKLPRDAHKGVAGRVLAFVGSRLYPGAAILVARAAQRAGAGLVTIGALDEALLAVVPPAAPEATYADLCGAADPEPRALRDLIARLEPHAIAVGSGLSMSERAQKLVRALLASESDVPLVIDADALNSLAPEIERVRAWRGPVAITPHPGEAARLLGRAVPSDDAGRRDAARELAERSGAIVCLKGHRTLVCESRDDRLREYVNRTGNPGMATAGSGDVLTGILAAYLAATRSRPSAQWTPIDAAIGAVHDHGRAGDLAVRTRGELGLVASDLIDALPRVHAT